MGRYLNDNVWVDGVMYAVNSTPPEDVAARIGAHAWREDGPVVAPALPEPEQSFAVEEVGPSMFAAAEPAEPPAETPEPVAEAPAEPAVSEPDAPAMPAVPPRGGPGSGKSVWAEYARAHGVSVEPGSSREDIIDQLDDVGVPTE